MNNLFEPERDRNDGQIYFQELQCCAGSEISVGFLMGRLMNQLHLEMVRISGGRKDCPIGISFPGYQSKESRAVERPNIDAHDADAPKLPPIGDKIRLFSRVEGQIENLALQTSLSRMRDYVEIGEIRPLRRKGFAWSTFRRHQPNGSVDSRIRRYMKRRGATLDEAKAYFEIPKAGLSDLPYLDMVSHSNQQRYRLFVLKQPIDSELGVGQSWGFSTYGLSASNGVPDF